METIFLTVYAVIEKLGKACVLSDKCSIQSNVSSHPKPKAIKYRAIKISQLLYHTVGNAGGIFMLSVDVSVPFVLYCVEYYLALNAIVSC